MTPSLLLPPWVSTARVDDTTVSGIDVIVIGSGAGGASAAAVLAESGRRVVIFEEGEATLQPGHEERFTLAGMAQRYRNAGQSVALGTPMIGWVEGIGAGGSTEVNSGLYHRPGRELLDRWRHTYRIDDLDADSLTPMCDEVERVLDIGLDDDLSPSAERLAAGADELGWAWRPIPRWVRRREEGLRRSTMTTTMLPRALAAGAVLKTGARVVRIVDRGGVVHGVVVRDADGERLVTAPVVVLAAGTIGSARLLKRSGLGRNVGRAIRFHPMYKLVARFDTTMAERGDLGSVQVLERAPRITIGSSASAPAVFGSALGRTALAPDAIGDRWPTSTIVYAAVCPTSHGRLLPGGIVRYQLDVEDLLALADGIHDAARVVFAAGARDVIGVSAGATPVTTPHELLAHMTPQRVDVTTVHVTSSLPMGEDRAVCAVDSFGQLHGTRGLYVCDASILPDAPGINPQGTVMALALRNAHAIAADTSTVRRPR